MTATSTTDSSISKAKLAAALHVTRQAVNKFLRAGLPCEPNGLLDRQQALAWVVAHASNRKGLADRAKRLLGQVRLPENIAPGAPTADESLAEAVRRKAIADADLKELAGVY